VDAVWERRAARGACVGVVCHAWGKGGSGRTGVALILLVRPYGVCGSPMTWLLL
jgi:hypothetical protein